MTHDVFLRKIERCRAKLKLIKFEKIVKSICCNLIVCFFVFGYDIIVFSINKQKPKTMQCKHG